MPAEFVQRVNGIFAMSKPWKCSEMYARSVYAYFRNSYSPDGAARDCMKAVRTGPPAYHMGYLCIKSYFPEHQPRTDLIENCPAKSYGGHPCVHCGQTVQYEAKRDALCVVKSQPVWSWNPLCASNQNGPHEFEEGNS
jgi:hypothetical protein